MYPVYPYIRPPKRVFSSCAFVCSTNYDYRCVNLNRMAVATVAPNMSMAIVDIY